MDDRAPHDRQRLAAQASPEAPRVELDLSQFREGDVVLRGEKVDGLCVYPDVRATAKPSADGPVLLRGNDETCEIVNAGLAPLDLCTADFAVAEPLPTPPHGCAGSSGSPKLDLSGGCLDSDHGAVAADCLQEPVGLGVVQGDEGVALTASHCPNRNLNSKISSGPTTVGVSMNYREHCNAGARVNSWTSYCSWASGQGWRNRYFAYGGGWNYDVAWRWTECAFDHRHGSSYDAYHYMGTEVDGWNWYSDGCSYWWSWNPHTNYVTYSCWYS